MAPNLLDPTLDVVFKLLLLRNRDLLVADLASKEVLSPELEIHVLELPKLHLASIDRRAKLDRWARFLRATKAEELEALAQEDPTMNTAKKALEVLSSDPEAQRIASDRETAVLMHRHLLAASREAGREEGRQEGARATLVRLLDKRFGPLPTWAQDRVQCADAEQLESYLDAVLTEASLEDVLKKNA